MTIATTKYFNQTVKLGDGTVRFNEDGSCAGIVEYNAGNGPLLSPDTLNQSQFNAAKKDPAAYRIEGEAVKVPMMKILAVIPSPLVVEPETKEESKAIVEVAPRRKRRKR